MNRGATQPCAAQRICSETSQIPRISSVVNVESQKSSARKAITAHATPASGAGAPAALPLASRRTSLYQLAASTLALGVGASPQLAPPAHASLAEGVDQVIGSCTGAVAAIAAIPTGKAAALGEQPLGSGIVWGTQGHIVVPYAPLTRLARQSPAGPPQVVVRLAADGGTTQQLPAAVVARDPSHELIVLQLSELPPAGLRPAPLGSYEGLRVGQDAYLLAAAVDGAPSVATGVVSALGRTIPASNNQAIPGVLQTDADVTQQSLGGALLDSSGRLIGMPVVAYVKPGSARSSGVNFALPADLLREVVPRLVAYGSAAARR